MATGLYYLQCLGSVVNLNKDPKVHFKYIQAATRTASAQIREKAFDRHPTLSGAQTNKLHVTSDKRWLVLTSISGNTPQPTNPSAFKVKGAMQFYGKNRGVSQPSEGCTAAFTGLKLDGHQNFTKLFTFFVHTAIRAKVSTLICSFTSFLTLA
jgi:clathrin heavy chain